MDIVWKHLDKALMDFGEKTSTDMKDTLTRQDHIDTGDLRYSIAPDLKIKDDRHFLYIDYLEYGNYAHRWFKKEGGVSIPDTYDDKTFLDAWKEGEIILTQIVKRSMIKDLMENIDTFIREYNTKNNI